MPHYADGSLASVGDQVVGKLYNSGPNPKSGVIISVTPGVDSCNAMVQFTEVVPVGAEKPRMACYTPLVDGKHEPICRTVKGEHHGSMGPEFVVWTCVDYCATSDLKKID